MGRAKVHRFVTFARFFAHSASVCAKISKKAEAIASSLRKNSYLCTRNYKTHNVMTENKTKKAFKDWDISDFDFAHATSLAHKPIRPGHPFNFFRTKK